MKRATGSFDIEMRREPPHDDEAGVSIGRTTLDKRFAGDLEGTSHGEMLAAMSSVGGSAGYVALERFRGTLEGKAGTFVLQHTGVMSRGTPSLSVVVVPDSGTGALSGLSGSMTIDVVEGKHFYRFEYEL